MRALLALAAAFTLLGCPPPKPPVDGGHMEEDAGTVDAGSDAGHPRPDAGVDAGFTSVPIAQWCETQALARCWRDIRCGRIDAALIDNCTIEKSLTCDSAGYERAADAGHLGYDPAAAADCLDAYWHGSCEGTPAACNGLFVGLAAPDAGCFVPESCDPDAGFCDPYDYVCPHRCVAWARLGERCQGSFAPRCGPGLGCEYPTDGGFNRECIVAHQEMETCDSFDSCASGLVCSSDKCLKQYAGEAEPCGVTGNFPACPGELFCRQEPPPMGGTPPPGTCQRRAGLGGNCNGLGSCLPALRCTSIIGTGTCETRAAIGEPCSSNFSFAPECMDGLFCSNTTSRCVPLPKDGGDCSITGSYYECAPRYYCDFSSPTYTCGAARADGEPCSYDGMCLSNECAYGMQRDGGYAYRCVRCSQVADDGGL